MKILLKALSALAHNVFYRYEVIWDTSKFNDPADWPEDGSQPFVWSFGDSTGYANHGDYVFGWKGDALQNILVRLRKYHVRNAYTYNYVQDTSCYATSCGGKQQLIADMNKCAGLKQTVDENIGVDSC